MRVSREMEQAWERLGLEGTDERLSEFKSVLGRAKNYVEAQLAQMEIPEFPASVAGFAFGSSYQSVFSACYPGYIDDSPQGVSVLDCPRIPVAPPFVKQRALLKFLDGQLVLVSLTPQSYSEAVRIIAERYGTPSFSVFRNGNWATATKESFSMNTSYNWYLRGGRIRVGRTSGGSFVAFIHSALDAATEQSY